MALSFYSKLCEPICYEDRLQPPILQLTKSVDKYMLRAEENVMNRVLLSAIYYYFYLVSSVVFNYLRRQLPALVLAIVRCFRGGISSRRCLIWLLKVGQWPRCKIKPPVCGCNCAVLSCRYRRWICVIMQCLVIGWYEAIISSLQISTAICWTCQRSHLWSVGHCDCLLWTVAGEIDP